MAEESENSPRTPKIIKLDGGSSRRNSTGKAISSNRGGKILPHYLRASTGSCHDFCKYGRKHAFEAKPRHPLPKRIISNPHGGQNLIDNVVLPERKKTLVVKLKPIPDSKTHTPGGQNLESAVLPGRKKTLVAKIKPIPDSRTHTPDAPNIINHERSAKVTNGQNLVENKVLAKKNTVVRLKPSPNSKTHSSDSSENIKQEVPSSSEKVIVSSKRASLKVKEKTFSAKPATSLKPKSVEIKPDPPGVLSSRRNSDKKILKRTGTSKVAVKKVFIPPAASFSPKPSLSRVASLNSRKVKGLIDASPLKNQNKARKAELKQPNNDEVQEKTLYVIKMDTENKPPESDENGGRPVGTSLPSLSSPESSSYPDSPSLSFHEEDQEESDFTGSEEEYTGSEAEDDYISENDEIVNVENAETLEGERGRRPRKAGMVCSGDKDEQPLKLKFRRGRVVDIQSENNGPRRLRFRRGRVLGENHNVKADARRRSFKRREVDGDTNGTATDSVKFVLKHQDMQGKKDSQGLFNNVIEETASKLVETQKSKVKALVGAFETVISLQESKPSANTVS